MKLQAHLSAVSVSDQDWHAAMIVFASLVAAVLLLLTLQSGVLLNNPLLEQLSATPASPEASVANRVSLDLHSWNHAISPSERFSVAHPLPASVALSQRFSIGIDAQVRFEHFGDEAFRHMSGEKETVPQLKPQTDRMLLMLMLFGLDKRQS
jgi:hypothetical protein